MLIVCVCVHTYIVVHVSGCGGAQVYTSVYKCVYTYEHVCVVILASQQAREGVQLVAGPPFPLLCHHESSGFQSEGTLSLPSSPPRFALSLYLSSGSAEEEHPATPVQLPLQVCCIPSLQ